MKYTTLKSELKLKDGSSFLAGTAVTVSFNETRIELLGLRDTPVKVSGRSLCKYVNGFKMPSMPTMERWVENCIAKSVTGCSCEPDGYSCDGAPSWLLVLGMI